LAFPITPYGADGSVDLDGVRANAGWLAASGVHALVAPSGTGELFSLTPDECAAVVEATVEATDGRIPVIAGVGFGPQQGVLLARRAERAGADGVLILPPYYAHPDPEGLVAYYRDIAAATRLGVAIYARDGAAITPPMLERMAREIPNLIALKDGRGDVRLFQRLREHVSERLGADRMVWIAGAGDDMVGPYFAAGAEGYTSSLACYWPEASLELLRLAKAGDYAELAAFHERAVRPFYELRQRRRGFEVAVMKAAMELLGHPAGPVRPPLGELAADERAELRVIIERLRVPTAAQRRGANGAS
ncbi:MAG TPA: dihydrodipicolinate synthase family protein, partial [Methylomirabilota bacterium]|nr:dihydrodipicolinate synthase family protein [Methylomirabilota bacterium]